MLFPTLLEITNSILISLLLLVVTYVILTFALFQFRLPNAILFNKPSVFSLKTSLALFMWSVSLEIIYSINSFAAGFILLFLSALISVSCPYWFLSSVFELQRKYFPRNTSRRTFAEMFIEEKSALQVALRSILENIAVFTFLGLALGSITGWMASVLPFFQRLFEENSTMLLSNIGFLSVTLLIGLSCTIIVAYSSQFENLPEKLWVVLNGFTTTILFVAYINPRTSAFILPYVPDIVFRYAPQEQQELSQLANYSELIYRLQTIGSATGAFFSIAGGLLAIISTSLAHQKLAISNSNIIDLSVQVAQEGVKLQHNLRTFALGDVIQLILPTFYILLFFSWFLGNYRQWGGVSSIGNILILGVGCYLVALFVVTLSNRANRL